MSVLRIRASVAGLLTALTLCAAQVVPAQIPGFPSFGTQKAAPVTSVDLRSSTVRSGDGRETLVPNSVLLEHKVSNWTLSDRKIRRSVRVGVADGTPMRAAAEKIEDCAKRHGNVLNNPPPQVLFEDFADSAQILTLYFWVEVSDKISSSQVASDLRFMIDKGFADDGIAIAFPQRDVRVDPSRPIRVEMVARAAGDDDARPDTGGSKP